MHAMGAEDAGEHAMLADDFREHVLRAASTTIRMEAFFVVGPPFHLLPGSALAVVRLQFFRELIPISAQTIEFFDL
ncbi:MAG: hypothetical protein U0744_00055 [Gemmataceae bacterium]